MPGQEEYLILPGAYDILWLGKHDVSAHVAQRKAPVLEHRGFSIPFWVGGLIPRLTTS